MVVKRASCEYAEAVDGMSKGRWESARQEACRQGRILYRSREGIDRSMGEVLDKQAATLSDARLILHKRSEGSERSGADVV